MTDEYISVNQKSQEKLSPQELEAIKEDIKQYQTTTKQAVIGQDADTLQEAIEDLEKIDSPHAFGGLVGKLVQEGKKQLQRLHIISDAYQQKNYKLIKKQKEEIKNELGELKTHKKSFEKNKRLYERKLENYRGDLSGARQEVSDLYKKLQDDEQKLQRYTTALKYHAQDINNQELEQLISTAQLDYTASQQNYEKKQEMVDNLDLQCQKYMQSIHELDLYTNHVSLQEKVFAMQITDLDDMLSQSKNPPFETSLLKSQLTKTKSYNLEDTLFEQKEQRVQRYNQATKNAPSDYQTRSSRFEKRKKTRKLNI